MTAHATAPGERVRALLVGLDGAVPDGETPDRGMPDHGAPDREAVSAQEDAPAVTVSVTDGDPRYARATVDVPPHRWRDAMAAARDDAELRCDFFDWLSAVDEHPDGFAVVAHLWSTTERHGLLLRTRLPREEPALDTVTGVYAGAAWHERETHEMFGVHFTGHPDLSPLLLPPEFEGHPLRKEFVLASRVAKPWPGAKEPGESAGRGGRRQPMRPPGVPPPDEWGPQAAARSQRTGEAQSSDHTQTTDEAQTTDQAQE